MNKRIAIIGAGLSGLCVARDLSAHADVVLFEKSRGVGGRMSTRYADPFYFDHGTQYFTARTQAFTDFLAPLIEEAVIGAWRGDVADLQLGQRPSLHQWSEPHWVATPHMNSLCKHLAQGLDVRLSVEVAPLSQRNNGRWLMRDRDGHDLGAFDWVVSTAPAVQTLRLLDQAMDNASPLNASRMKGCYALMIGLRQRWDQPWIAAKVRDNPIAWIAVNSTKPHRDHAITSLVVHSDNDWAEQHIDEAVEDIQPILISQFEALTGMDVRKADYLTTHRWRYALVGETGGAGFMLDPNHHTAATGDWASVSRIEEVWHNAKTLAKEILALV